MKASKVYLTGILTLLVFAGVLIAQNPYRMKQLGENRQNKSQKERLMSLPDLTDEQKQEMKDIRLSAMKSIQPIKNELGEKLAKLQTLESADEADLEAINKLIDEIAILKTKMAKIRASNKQKIRSVLNDEQRIIFDTKKNQQKRLRHGEGKRMRLHSKRWMEN